MEISELREVANDLPFLKTGEEREKLLGVVGALVLRRISLARAAEIMGMQREALQTILDALAVNYSFLESADVETEKSWT
jgi:predicted HTH domain antitoxin